MQNKQRNIKGKQKRGEEEWRKNIDQKVNQEKEWKRWKRKGTEE